MKKKLLSLLLCALLVCAVMAVPGGAAAAGGCETHNFVESTVKLNLCTYGLSEVHVSTCQTCGFSYMTAVRPDNASGWPNGSHSWTVETTAGVCSAHPATVKVCSKCLLRELVSLGGHQWSDWMTQPSDNVCTQATTKTRSCACGAVETRQVGGFGHSWTVVSISAATCTEPGKTVQRCTVCNTQEEVITSPALGHQFHGDQACDEQHVCSRCGATIAGYAHTYVYEKNDTNHWSRCTRCGKTTGAVKHSYDASGTCVCGAKTSGCSHNFVVTKSAPDTAAYAHREKCTLCGTERNVICTGNVAARKYCTDPLYCICGRKVQDGQKNHNFGVWICNDATHKHQCLNRNCQYNVEAAHTFATVAGVKKCSVCSFSSGTAAHTHTYGAWTVSSNGTTHVRTCTVAGCTAQESSSHTGGTPNCAGKATCSVCHAVYQAGSTGSQHTGGTEVRNATAAQVGKAGYTGDTYCLTCGKKIAEGQAIPALTASHTHSFASTWTSDGTHHWHACSCGEKTNQGLHTFKAGTCITCGAKDPNYVDSAVHQHAFSAQWTTSSKEHWHACTVTGCHETADRGEHVVVEVAGVQKCATCGELLGEIAQQQKEEQKLPEGQRFVDVPVKEWYYEASSWGVDDGIVVGVSTTEKKFAPLQACKETEILQMLWRAYHSPEPKGSNPYGITDWSKDATTWAYEEGILEETFDPATECTRAQAVYFLWKAASCPEPKTLVSFNDVDPNAYYAKAVSWALENRITAGTDAKKGLFSPNDVCNRAHIVCFLQRELDPNWVG